MARRRINKGFILKIAGGFLLVVGGTYGWWKFHKPHNPTPYIVAGDDALKRLDYNTAADNFAVASEMLPQDETLHLKLGQCYIRLQHSGFDRYADAVTQFTRAEELNPNDAEAWAGLLEVNEYQVTWIENHASDARLRQQLSLGLTMMRDAAEHLGKLRPEDIQAVSAKPILIIHAWISNLTLPDDNVVDPTVVPAKQTTPEHRAEQAMAQLTKLVADHPENDQIPYWIARGKIFQAQQALRSTRSADAVALFAEASTQFDANILARPGVVGLYMGKASILIMLHDLDTSPENNYLQRLRSTLEIAQDLVDPEKSAPDDYERVKVQWAEILKLTDPTGAEDVYRKLIEHFPDQVALRIQLARLLDGAGRPDDALAVVDAISTLQGPPVTEIARRDQWDQQVADSKLVRANVAIDKLSNTSPGKQHDDLVKQITASIDAAEKRYAGTSKLLRLKGRFQMVNGQRRDAIDTLTKAAERAVAEGGALDYELLRDEAMAYADGGQGTRAVGLLESALSDPVVANNAEIHRTLAQLNLQNLDYVSAKPQIDWLAARLPDDPKVICLEIQELGPDPEWAKVEPLFNRLPEQNRADLKLKAAIAEQTHNNHQAIRLLTLLNNDNPGDINIAMRLASHYQLADQNELAKAVLEACKKLNPDAVVEPAPADDLERIGAIKDLFAREVRYAEYYRNHQQPEVELTHLLKALQIQPDNKEILTNVFFHYLVDKRIADAQAMVQHLSDLDADGAHGLILESKLALAMNDPPAAIRLGRQLTHDLPNFAKSWEIYGEALQASMQFDLAAPQFQNALLLQATDTDALVHLVQCRVAEGKLTTARSELTEACARYPGNTAFRDIRQRFEMNSGNPETILPELAAQIQQHPDEKVGYQNDIDSLDACMRIKASQDDVVAARGYQQQAIDLYATALRRWPDDLNLAQGSVRLYFNCNDQPSAERILNDLSQRPTWKDKPRPLIMLGQLYLSEEKFDPAEEVLTKALRLWPDSVEAAFLLSDCKRAQNKPDEALAVLRPGTANPAIRQRYIELLLDLQRFPEADTEVSEANKIPPGNVDLINLALKVCYTQATHGTAGTRDQGIALASDSVNAKTGNSYAYLWRAKLLLLSPPNFDGASMDLIRFLILVPGDAEAHILLARVIEGKNDHEGAILELTRALKYAPQDKTIRLNLVAEYLTSTPPRTAEAQALLQASLATPMFAHDPDLEARLALILAQGGDTDRAVRLIQQTLARAANKSPLLPDYFKILLLARNYELLLSEADKYYPTSNRPMFVSNDRGLAKAALGDITGAVVEFNAALDLAGAEQDTNAAREVVNSICSGPPPLGNAKALELVLPRAKDSPALQLIAIELYLRNDNRAGALNETDLAMSSIDRLTPRDQFRLLSLAADVYLSAVPAQTDKALDADRKLLAMQPGNLNTLNNIACVLVDVAIPPDPAQALKYSQKAYDLSSKNGELQPNIADTQGWVLIQNGKTSDGIALLQKAVELHAGAAQANFPDVYYHLAIGYLKIRQADAAKANLVNAQEMIDLTQNNHQAVDPILKSKIDAAMNQANEMIHGPARPATAPN